MKRLLLTVLLVITGVFCYSQTYNNEWIDYTKTYYKFKVGANSLYRIPQTSLVAAGLGGTDASYFQLWHNGTEVTIYTTVSTGAMGPTDYIEFYGEINDGTTDTRLYKFDSLQMSSKWSLYTDTSAYFLTVNSAGGNKRYINTGNNVAGNVLPAETYFMHTLSKYYRDMMNPGLGVDLGELVHSASYESAEGWSSSNITSSLAYSANYSNLYVYSSGPVASVNATVVGNSEMERNVTLKINSNTVGVTDITGFDIKKISNDNIALSTLSGSIANFGFSHDGPSGDKIVISNFQLTYPRQYFFDGQPQFYFELPPGPAKYIEIANFNYSTGTPILLDLANNLRITSVVNAGLVKIVVPASALTRKLLLLSTTAVNIKTVSSLVQRNFINYAKPANQGDYLIISHASLFDNGAGVNNVEQYRLYRSSANGGGYNARIYDIDQLTDQFAFGVKHHPAAIRNFSAYAINNFPVMPKYVFLVGKGLSYSEFRGHENDANVNKLALVPTFGFPSSDNLLTASRTGEYPLIPIGRLSAINGSEVGKYLNKIMQFEQAQVSNNQTIEGKGWMKNMAQLTGGLSDAGLSSLISSYMDGYRQISSDSLFGAKVYMFNKNSGVNTAEGSNKTIENLFSEGMSMLMYFGHSSPNTIEFNLDNPANYNNTGKYPLIVINGCNSGDLFQFDTLRSISKGTLSEQFVFADQKGSIGYIASTHFGLPTELNYVNTEFYNNLCKTMYGQSLGNIMQRTMQNVSFDYASDYIAQTHVEEITLHGDPAIRINPHGQPDYVVQDSLITFDPSIISVADNSLTITARFINIGKAVNDSLTVRVQHKLPDNSVITLTEERLKPLVYEDSLVITVPLNPLIHKGLNQVIVTLDPDNLVSELSESNNTLTKNFTVIEDEIRPIWPYEYSIISTASPVLYASTANPVASAKDYVMQMDTTANFNSALMVTKTVTDSGGVISFTPGITLMDSTVYYWRVANGPVNAGTHWLHSSFVYINGGSEGYNQSHYFQFKNDDFATIVIDSNTRKFGFADKTRRLLIRTGLYPYYGWDQINVNVDDDQVDYYGCKYNSIQVLVYDPLTLKPWKNYNTGGYGRFGSFQVCDMVSGGRNFFEFPYNDSSYRRKAMQFLDSIPEGSYVSISNLGMSSNNAFISQWKSDTSYLGSGKSLWHKFHQLGMHKIDSFYKNLPFLFVYKKGDTVNFPVKQSVGATINSQLAEAYNISGKQVEGTITSPWLGPAKAWNRFKWDEIPQSGQSNTQKQFDLVGKDIYGFETTLASIYNSKDTDITFIDAANYPYLKMMLYNKDEQYANATQLKYWMLTDDKFPEAAVSPNMVFKFQDTLNITDTLHFKVGLKNISNSAFDSIRVRLIITDEEGNDHFYNNLGNGARIRPLAGNDSVEISYDISVLDYLGQNQLMLEVNPSDDQPEQFHFNNFLYKAFVVKSSPTICPGSSAYLSAGRFKQGNTYKWQVNTGGGYIDLSDNSLYSGSSSRVLVLDQPATSLYGYKYRCIITNNAAVTYSEEIILKFQLTWKGTVSTAWENAGNWSCTALPDANTDVIIDPALVNSPVIIINSNAVCRSIRVKPTAVVTISSGKRLDIKGPPGQ